MAQRRDREVVTDEDRKRDTTAALRRVLRRHGIRDPHTSRKAREFILSAATSTTPGSAEAGR